MSSLPLVETVIVPDKEPAVIFSGLSETVYSLASAVPDTLNGISISFSLASERVAVIIKSVDEFSTIDSALCEKFIVGGSSSSFIVKVNTSLLELLAPSTVPGIILRFHHPHQSYHQLY